MRTRNWLITAITVVVLMCTFTSSAAAAYQWGSTQRWPWSGYWWPMLDTSSNLYDPGQALEKYDKYVVSTGAVDPKSQAFEKDYFSTTDAANNWWGHCHAWSAAAILTKEPPASITKGGQTFSDSNLKGLLTDLYFDPKYEWLSGQRSDTTDVNDPAYKDIDPAWMDWLLQYYVRHYRYSFIMDTSANSEVWNFPVVAYTRSNVVNLNKTEDVTTTVWYANPQDARGTKYFSYTYTYRLTPAATGGYTGAWTGTSVTAHPDFAWVPTGHVTDNTWFQGETRQEPNRNHKLNTAKVAELIGNGYQIP